MRHHLLLALLFSSVLSIILVLMLVGGTTAQTDPPTTGDWVVSDTTVVSDSTVDLRGDLLVTSTGHLTLENVTLRVHVASDGEHGIEVQGGGTLLIRDADSDPDTSGDASSLVAVPNQRAYYFICRAGSTLRIINSLVTDCGHTGMAGQERWGVYIATDDAVISGTSIDGCLYGLVVENGEAEVHDSWIRNSTYHGLVCTDSIVTVTGTTLADSGYEGARVVGGTASFSSCQVLNNRNGMALRTGTMVTVASTLVSGNTYDGIMVQATAKATITNCTIRANDQYGIRGEDFAVLQVVGTDVVRSARDGLFVSNGVMVTSQGSVYRGGVYGVRLNMNCRMTSTGDAFRGNTNSGVYLESTSRILLVDGQVSRNSAGLRAEDLSTVVVWNTTMEECNFEGYKLTDSDLELHDGTIVNCTGGGIVLSGNSVTDWTVHPSNRSRVLNSDLTLDGDLLVHGDLELRGNDITFITAPLSSHVFTVDGGYQDWQSTTIGTSDPTQGIALSFEGTARGRALSVQLEAMGKVFSTQPSYARVKVPFEFVQCTFRDGDHGLEISSTDVLVDRSNFINNLVGAHVQGVPVSFENCTFTSSSNWHLRVEGGGHARMANCTFDPAKVENAGVGDSWSAWWTVHVKVEFGSGRSVVGARLTVSEMDGTQVFNGTTNANGRIIGLFLHEHTTTGSARTSYTPHTFNATFGTSIAEGPVDIDGFIEVTIVMADRSPPELKITSHTDGQHIPTPLLVLRGTAVDTGSGVLRVDARIGTSAWQQCDGTDAWQWSYRLQGDGRYPITVRARDLSNNDAFMYINLTVDTQPPVIDIEVPPTPGNNSRVGNRNITIFGYVDQVDTVVTVDNMTTTREGTRFTANVTMADGLNVVVIRAVDLAGNKASREWWVWADLEAPPLVVTSPLNGSRLNSTTVILVGHTAPGIQAYYRVAELSTTWSTLPVSAQGNFSQTLTNLNQGVNTLEVMVTDAVDNRAQATVVVIVDTVTPKLVSASPVDGTYLGEEWLNLSGTYSESLSALTVFGVSAVVNGTTFSINVRLTEDMNLLTLTAKDLVGNVGIANLRYFLDLEPPFLELDDFEWDDDEGAFIPAYTNQPQYVLVGRTELGSNLYVDMLSFQVDDLGKFAAQLDLDEGENTLVVMVRDRAGNEIHTNLTIFLDVRGPELEVHSPEDMERTSNDYVWVEGTVTPGDFVVIDGTTYLAENGTFKLKVSLHDTVNLVTVTARDLAGNEVSVERLVFVDVDREGLSGYAILDENCNALLVVVVIILLALGIIAAYVWRGEYIVEMKERQLEAVLEEDHIELDKPHMEPSSGHLVYDPTSPTGRRAEVREVEDEEFISMDDFRREMEKRGS